VLFPGSVVYVWHAGRHASTLQDSLTAVGFDVRSQIIWAKDRFALSRGHLLLAARAVLVRGAQWAGHWSGDRKQSTLWQIPAREGTGFEHGTQKPWVERAFTGESAHLEADGRTFAAVAAERRPAQQPDEPPPALSRSCRHGLDLPA
jgi:N6-adenosine-specific RNA methylase IME4